MRGLDGGGGDRIVLAGIEEDRVGRLRRELYYHVPQFGAPEVGGWELGARAFRGEGAGGGGIVWFGEFVEGAFGGVGGHFGLVE